MDGDSDASSAASAAPAPAPFPPAELTEDDVRLLHAGEGGWEAGYWPYMIGTEDNEMLVRMGSLNKPAVLESLLAAGRWQNVASYIEKALTFHRDEAKAAVAYPDGDDAPSPDDMLRAHPELFVLPRRQHALELLGEGKQAEAQQYFKEEIFEPTRVARRTPHLDTLLARLQDMLVSDGAAPQLDHERDETSRHIQEYLRVYFPTFDRGPEVVASMARSKEVLYTTAAFGELVHGHNYRCLVCHQPLALHSAPDNRMVEHLHDACPAITPAIRRRLPRRNRPLRPQQPPPPPPAAAAADDDDDPHQEEADEDVAPD